MTAVANEALIAAIRRGSLQELLAALDSGADARCADQLGEIDLPLRLAVFGGVAEIIRELVRRGADVNHSTRRMPFAPLALAVKTGKPDIVRLLIELGARIPPGMQTGLSLRETLAAQGVAHRSGADANRTAPARRLPDAPLLPETPVQKSGGSLPPDAIVEEIDMQACYGVDTNVLEADAMRIAQQTAAPEPSLDVPPLETGKSRFWKKK